MIINNICIVVILLSWSSPDIVVSQCQMANVCEADVTDEDCLPGQVMVPNAGIFGCCPGCQAPPADTNETIAVGCRPPSSCLPDGRYAPVQCKGDFFTGRCFCSDESGRRIFGQMWRNEGSDMTCACSRRRAELEATGRVVTLHCSPTGDYEPLQCDDGLCWCAEPKTGQPTVIPVIEKDMMRLPCYDAAKIGEKYLRRCESIIHSQAMIQKEQSEHGTNFLGHTTTVCDYDGSFGPYQILNDIASCISPSGTTLGSYAVTADQTARMTCNCARDRVIYFPEKGMTHTEVCQANGNYRPNQNVGDVYYCVDADGYPMTEMLDEWPVGECSGYIV